MRAFEPPRDQVKNRAVELPDGAVLCARHGLAIGIDPQRRVLRVVRDGAPSDGQAAALGHAGLALDCGPYFARCKLKYLGMFFLVFLGAAV